MDIQQFRIPGSEEAIYIPEFVTEEEERYLLHRGDSRASVEDAS